MKNFRFSPLVLAVTFALPLAAQAQQAPAPRLTEAQLLVNPAVVKFCKDKNKYVASAKYQSATGNTVSVACTDTINPLPLGTLGGLGASTTAVVLGGLVLGAVAIGGNGATPDTN